MISRGVVKPSSAAANNFLSYPKVMKTEQLPLIFAVAIIGYLMCRSSGKSAFAPLAPEAAPEPQEAASCPGGDCGVQSGPGLASSLMPKEVKPQEDYGSLKVDRLLEGQTFIHGMPGSVSGSLRNANQSIRNDPFIPRKAVSIFNQSTIVADRMRPSFEIGNSA